MTEANATQTAVDTTKTPATPGAEVTQDARTDGDKLDTLLKEYDTTTAPPAPTTPATPAQAAGTHATPSKPATDPALADVQRYIFRQDMDKTVTAVRGDLPSEQFDDTLVRAWINARADEDPRLAQAWLNRHDNPKQFERVVNGLGREFAKKYGKQLVDRQATEDRDAVAAAVRGASTKAPPAQSPDFAKMTPGEFQAEKDRLFGN